MKAGFTFAMDLRVPLRLFTTSQFHTYCCPKRWLQPEKVADAFVFMSGPSGKASSDDEPPPPLLDDDDPNDLAIGAAWRDTATLFRELVLRWGTEGEHVAANRLEKLLRWVTGVGELPGPGQRITVLPASSSKHLPSTATCSLTLRLPPIPDGGGVEALEATLLNAMVHERFSAA